MAKSKRDDSCPDVVLALVDRFAQHTEDYKRPDYNETEVRREFIDPMFKALGWDIDNEQGHAEAYKDVIHEDAVKIGGSTKAPDYGFRIGGVRKFFVEAKKPAEDIKQQKKHAYQLRRYAWSAKLPISILTDFEEFAVYDCTKPPKPTDRASTALLLYLTCDQYADRWHEIASVFAKDAILSGSFDKYAASARRKRGTAEVDDEFLKEIESWREELARNIALRNDLSVRDLNFAVSKIIDRIIFLRMCEDRGVEIYAHLGTLRNGPRIYPRLVELFRRADDRYNSGLFHFSSEPGRSEAPDELTPGLTINDKVLKGIISRLYYPQCQYEFSVMPPEILGQVYEQFLGKVIRLTAGGRAKVEEKPEVKKAGGVYYTPRYIVDYIVEHTVGKLLEGKTPEDIGPVLEQRKPKRGRVPKKNRARKGPTPTLRILDPACGSGSFLLGAYQYLLRWHIDWYVANGPEHWAKKPNPPIYQSPKPDPTATGPTWRLTVAERKRILVNNIYGVDIDPQAVEVTKLSLLLEVLQGETQQTLEHLYAIHERALPDLSQNIKCGNSLIGPDFYDNQQMGMFDEEERLRINVFPWEAEFKEIMQSGGFDAVIGNPPYGAMFTKVEMEFLRNTFRAPQSSFDSFILFMEKAAQLLSEGGIFGMIIPSGWTSTPSARLLRKLFIEAYLPSSFVSLPFDVFRNAYIDTIIVTATKAGGRGQKTDVDLFVFPQRFRISSLEDFAPFHKMGDWRSWLSSEGTEFLVTCSTGESSLISKLQGLDTALGDFVEVKRGIEVFKPTARSPVFVRPIRAFAGTLQRYLLRLGDPLYVDYPETIERFKPLRFFSGDRILIRQVLSRRYRLQAVFTEQAFLTSQSVQSLVSKPDCPVELRFLLGLINSQLLAWYFRTYNSVARRDDFPKIIIAQTRSLPIRLPQTKDAHDRMTSLVQSMLSLKAQLPATKTAHTKTATQRQIDAVDRQIDKFVYKLYGLTEDEIRIVEEATP